MKYFLLACILFLSLHSFPQFVAEHVSNTGIYDLLDELASERVIEVNTTIKPWSKSYIADKLNQAVQKKDQLNKRQLKELEFYLKAYRPALSRPDTLKWNEPLNIFRKNPHLATSLNPFGLIYKDALFTLVARPIYGYEYLNNKNGSVTHTYGGFDIYSTIGHLGIYASLRDNYETSLLADTGYFTLEGGGAFKRNNNGRQGGDFSEMRGGITYEWKWGDIGIVKDHFVWGDNYHGSNIFSGRTPSFAHLRLHLHPAKWLDFNYVHGWLVSEVIDSARSYYYNGQKKDVFEQKWLAANMLTITPFRGLNISLGNSIVYSDLGGIHLAYLIPFAFFKSIDHTLNHGVENQNSQMFLSVSSRQIRHLNIYGSLFVDEFSFARLKKKDAHNFLGWKGGICLSNFPIRNITLVAEFTQSTPITYKHDVKAITFASSSYSLGHYLLDNSREIYFSLRAHPLRNLNLRIDYTFAEHGNEYDYVRNADIDKKPVLKDISWKSAKTDIRADYHLMDNCLVYIQYSVGNTEGGAVDGKTAQYYLDRFTPPFYQGKTSTLGLGLNLGF